MVMTSDPYLLWAQATGFRDYELGPADPVAVAIECLPNESVPSLIAAVTQAVHDGKLQKGDVEFLPLFRQLPRGLGKIRFCTARVNRKRLAFLATLVARIDLGLAIKPALAVRKTPLKRSEEKQPLIAFIDDQFAFANSVFSEVTGKRSRFFSIWNQGHVVPGGKLKWWPGPGGIGQVCYPSKSSAAVDHDVYPPIQRRFTHGTHIASVAAGRGFAGGFAADAELVGVQFPREVVEDTSGGAMAVQVLEAIHFILSVAEPLPKAGEASDGTNARPVVINLSYGTNAGPHDGHSLLEAAMDELVNLRKGRLEIVVPAGNQHESRGHACFDLDAVAGVPDRVLEWQVLPDDGTPSFLELWLDAGQAADVSITVSPPFGSPSPAVSWGQTWAADKASWGIFFSGVPSAGSTRVGALIALASSRRRDHCKVTVPHGVWDVKIALVGGAAKLTRVRAWIERDDFMTGYRRNGRQGFFLDGKYRKYRDRYGQPADDSDSLVKRAGAFNKIANGARVIVAGGYVRKEKVMAPYSAESSPGLSARTGPDVSAPSEASETLHGIRGAAFMGSDTVRLGGTSVAAPQVTRRIANWMREAQLANLSDWDKVDLLNKMGHPGYQPWPAPRRPAWEGGGRLIEERIASACPVTDPPVQAVIPDVEES